MVIVLVLLTVILFVAIDYFLRKKKEKQVRVTISELTSRTQPSVIASRTYYHPSHSWGRIVDDYVIAGVDDFARRVLGRINRLFVPPVGSYVEQGQVIWKLQHDKKVLPQLAPVSGEVVAVNQDLVNNPEIINIAPDEAGWILKIEPSDLKRNLKNLLHGETALQWLDNAREQLIRRFSGTVGPVCQDGGELIDGVSDLLTDDEWKETIQEFFQVGFEDELGL